MQTEEIENLKKAGEIASKTIEYAKQIIKPGMKLLEIAEKIEAKILELGGKFAFPTNLSINEIAAHYTPSYNDETLASGLLKVDLGAHIDGFISDTAFSLNLEGNAEQKQENDKLIEASKQALQAAISVAAENIEIWKIGEAIHKTITEKGFSPIRNLSGHELKQFNLHAGVTIPNYNNNSSIKLAEGAYAIEPFATTGQGVVYDGKPSNIYKLIGRKPVRDSLAREILSYIEDEFLTLPFCSRWIVKKFSTRALISLRLLEQAGVLYHFPQLVEKMQKPVSQAEHTIIIYGGKVEVTTQ